MNNNKFTIAFADRGRKYSKCSLSRFPNHFSSFLFYRLSVCKYIMKKVMMIRKRLFRPVHWKIEKNTNFTTEDVFADNNNNSFSQSMRFSFFERFSFQSLVLMIYNVYFFNSLSASTRGSLTLMPDRNTYRTPNGLTHTYTQIKFTDPCVKLCVHPQKHRALTEFQVNHI